MDAKVQHTASGRGGEVPIELQELILDYVADNAVLVGSVQRVCKAWRDITCKILIQRQTDLIRQVGLVQSPKRKYKETPRLSHSVILLRWEHNGSETAFGDWFQNSVLTVTIQKEGEQQSGVEMTGHRTTRYDRKSSKQWTGQQIYHEDIFERFFNEDNATGFAMSRQCKEQMNTQALRELIKLMVLSSSPSILQTWSFSRNDGDTYESNSWSCVFHFHPNPTAALWASVWKRKPPSNCADSHGEGSGANRVMSLRFQLKQNAHI